MVIFEKTRQLARRVPFQRALDRRGLQLIENPEPIRYRLVEEIADDGPFYVVQKESCLLYTSDAADERSSVDLGGRRIIKKKKYIKMTESMSQLQEKNN